MLIADQAGYIFEYFIFEYIMKSLSVLYSVFNRLPKKCFVMQD